MCCASGALQALSQNLLSPGAGVGGVAGPSAAIVPDSAADAVAAEIAQAVPMHVDVPANQVRASAQSLAFSTSNNLESKGCACAEQLLYMACMHRASVAVSAT